MDICIRSADAADVLFISNSIPLLPAVLVQNKACANFKKIGVEEDVGGRIPLDLYNKLRLRTLSAEIRGLVNQAVELSMKDPTLPGLEITRSLHADHIVPMKTITEMEEFSQLSVAYRITVCNYKSNFVGLGEAASTSKAATAFFDWALYRKAKIAVDAVFRASRI